MIYEQYKEQRNLTTNMIKKQKRIYLSRMFSNAKGDAQKTWRIINELLERKIRVPIDEILQKNFKTDKIYDLANNFNVQFLDRITELKDKNKGKILQLETVMYQKHGESTSFLLRKARERDVKKILSKLNKTGPGIDQIRYSDIVENKLIFVPLLTHLLNIMFTTHSIPPQLKISCVTPLYKKGEVDSIVNYRPVGSMPVIEKVMEKFLNMQINKYLSENCIIPNFQHGFQTNKSTLTLMQDFSEIINKSLDRGQCIVILFADLTAAFDVCDHDRLLEKFKDIGICHPILNNYFDERRQVTKIGKTKSSQKSVQQGLIQGGITSASWYNVYTYDMKYLKIRGKMLQYADDTCIISAHLNLDQAIKNTQADLITLQKYYYNNQIFLNDKKTEVMMLGNQRNIELHNSKKIICHKRKCLEDDEYLTKECDCPKLEYTNNVRYLGIQIDDDYKMKNHVTTLCKKLRIINFNFRKTGSNKIPMTAKKMMYYSLVESILRYGSTTYTFAPQTVIQPLNSIQNKIKSYLFQNEFRNTLLSADELANFQLLYDNFNKEEYRQKTDHRYLTRHQSFIRTIPNNLYGERILSYKIPKLLELYCLSFLNEENKHTLKIKIKKSIIEQR